MSHQHEGTHHHHGHGGTPTQVLMEEHELILQALGALEKRLNSMQEPAAADRAYFEKGVEFLRGFADKCHHGKEEDLLFKRMGERGFPTQGGPIAVMLSEHQAGRAFIRGIAEAAARIGTDPKAGDALRHNGYGYIALLRDHIAKENQVLFPMADRVLSAEDQHDLQHAFDRFEQEETGAGVHERMLGLLRELTGESK
jgi:hemerythrin-like domain-containing protein